MTIKEKAGLAVAGIATAVLTAVWLWTSQPGSTTPPQPWVGVNVWGLAANDTDGYSCGSAGGDPITFLDNTMHALSDANVQVVRFWAFQPYAMAPSDGHRDWSAIDRAIVFASEYGIQLIPVLDNHWNDCSYWPVSLYPNGHSGQGYTVSNAAYATEFACRYGNNPAIYAIEVINEDRETTTRQAFKDDLKARIDAVKSCTDKPVGIGNDTDGVGSLNVAGADMAYRDTYTYTGATIATTHDYGDWNVGLPGSPSCQQNSICWQYHEAQALGLPFYIGETGADTCDNAAKAAALTAKLQAAKDAGIAGVIYWAFDIRTSVGNCGFDIGVGGPTLNAIRDFQAGGTTSVTPTPPPTLTITPTPAPTPVPVSPSPTPTPVSATAIPAPTASPTMPAPATQSPSPQIVPTLSLFQGDVNCDGRVDALDALAILASLAGIQQLQMDCLRRP